MSSTLTILGCGYIGSALAEVALEKKVDSIRINPQ